jgi:hypothetical protein
MSDVPSHGPSPLSVNESPPGSDTERAEHTRRVAPPVPQPPRPVPGQQRPANTVPRRTYPPAQPPVYPPAQPPYAPVRAPASRSRRVSESGLYLPWWSLVVMVVVVGFVAFGLLLTISTLNQPQALGNQTPRIQMITSQPTLSQDFASGGAAVPQNFFPTPIPQVYPTPTVPLPTPVPSPTIPPGNFMIGATVQVVGVESSGLNIRSAPGYEGKPQALAYDGEVFVLVDGPQTADGLEWWHIDDPDDPNRSGWAARNFLTGVAQ